MIRHIVLRTKLLVPMLLLLAVNCSSDDKAGTGTTEPSATVKTTEVDQDELGEGPATPTGDTGDSNKSPSKEIVPIAKLTLAESEILDSVSVIKDEVCACKTMECGELTMRVMDKLDWNKQMSASTRKKIEKLRQDTMICMMRVAAGPPQKSSSEQIASVAKPTLTDSEILALVTSTKEAVCACKDLECGAAGMKTMDSLSETKEPSAPTLKKIEKLFEEMTTCIVTLSATPTH